jgi:hypothetical protein
VALVLSLAVAAGSIAVGFTLHAWLAALTTVGGCNGWLLAFDNLSHLTPDLEDCLCRVAYGVASAGRKIHTNTEESVIKVSRPVSLNGISAAITAQDLVDRTEIEVEILDLGMVC